MNEKKLKIIQFLCMILVTTFVATEVFSSNIIDTTSAPVELVEESILQTLSPEEIIAAEQAHNLEIANAIQSVTGIEPANLPTLLKQPEFHPDSNDTFGFQFDTTPIFQVDVDPSDEERKNLIAFSFDSAYINKYTYKILDILDEYDVKATFFMTNEFMVKNKEQIIEIIKRGHEIGNHTTTHPDLNLVSDAKLAAEVMQCHNFLKYLTGVNMCLFRFPFGSYSPRTVTMLKLLGYYPIQWTVDSIDWRNEGKDVLINRIKESNLIIPGAILLFHNGATYTPDALPEIFEFIFSKGLKPCKVSDLIYKHDFYLNNGHQIKKINE